MSGNINKNEVFGNNKARLSSKEQLHCAFVWKSVCEITFYSLFGLALGTLQAKFDWSY
jgi:hypothetical protein